jgi:TP901 family phage tail tape measure protein
MEAANARVLAFGASVGVLSAVTKGFKDLITTTIEVEKQMTAINSILGQTGEQLSRFKKEIFDVAKNTEQSFDTVANAALELSRQGLKAEEVQKRLNDALILSRLSGLGAAEAVAGLTAAINSFNREGVTSAEVLNKLSAAAVSAAVSERDLIEGIKRSGAVLQNNFHKDTKH